MDIEFFLFSKNCVVETVQTSGTGCSLAYQIFWKSVSCCELSWFHKLTNLCVLFAAQYSYNSESPYLVNTAKGTGAVGWLDSLNLVDWLHE
jgi:hypothetical protein